MNTASLLLMDTDTAFLRNQKSLLDPHFQVLTAEDFSRAKDLLTEAKPECALIEYRLGDINGHQVAAWIREHLPYCRVLLMSSHWEKNEILESFSHRIFDVLEKPFSMDAVLGKLREAVDEARKCRQLMAGPADNSPYRLDPELRVLHHGQQVILLTITEVKVLQLLLQSENQVVPREVLVRQIWGESGRVAENTLDTHLTNLRKKAPFLKAHIRGLRGVGYVFESKGLKIDSNE